MDVFETEEKLDVLSYVVESLNAGKSYLEEISLTDSTYNLFLAQLNEMCVNLEADKEDLIQNLDNFYRTK